MRVKSWVLHWIVTYSKIYMEDEHLSKEGNIQMQ